MGLIPRFARYPFDRDAILSGEPEELLKYMKDLLRELMRSYDYIYMAFSQTYASVGEIRPLDDSATPSVKGWDKWKTGGTTTITNFLDGLEGQVIHIIAEHTVTVTNGTNIFLNGATSWTMTATDTLTLIQKAGQKWYELSRSENV